MKHPQRDIVMERGARFATLEERMAAGKALRKRVPRTSQALWAPWKDRPDPVALLEGQNKTRVASLVPIRWGRMLVSPFTLMRGAALVMATDLSTTPNTGIEVQACGDCHLLNFGAYATPERDLAFDINDFDEAQAAPWEWDVKRLAASLEHAGRDVGISRGAREDAVRAMARNYRDYMAKFAELTVMDPWYFKFDAKMIEGLYPGAAGRKRIAAETHHAQKRTMESAVIKLTSVASGRRRFVDDPPELFHLREGRGHTLFNTLFDNYLATVRDDLRVLLRRFRASDFAFKLVGVGSVGTRCGVVLMMANNGDPLLLQVKEANQSVLAAYAKRTREHHHGQRVVTGQRIMQAASDMFLGWTSFGGRDYYVRQLRDMKWAVDASTFNGQRLMQYASLCGAVLASAHARSTDAAVLSGYLGSKGVFDDAMTEFARAYADQGERDFEQLQAAAKKGRINALGGSRGELTAATKKAIANTVASTIWS